MAYERWRTLNWSKVLLAAFVTITWILIAPLIAAGLTASQIVIWLTLVPYLFLPERFAINLPGLPDIDKTAAVTIGLVLAFLLHREKFSAITRPSKRSSAIKVWVGSFFALMVLGALFTLFTNREPLFYGPTVLPALRLWDSISLLSGLAFFVIPFFFAWRYLPTPTAHLELLRALVAMGLIYSLLMLVEIRLSPQLHTWLYGYFQHSFVQHIRGGFRPIVFLQHGIAVGFFIFMAVLAALAQWKSTQETKWLLASIWLFSVLAISKNMGAMVICIVSVILYVFATHRVKGLFAVTVALIVLIYPAFRQAELIPLEKVVDLAAAVSPDRAGSLQYRLNNEDQLLSRAYIKPFGGWGGYARDQIFNNEGVRTSVSEGRWIQTIGSRGWLGYIALFGVLTVPIFLARKPISTAQTPPETTVLAIIMAGNLIYMIPNSTLTPISWLVFGSLSGYLRHYPSGIDIERPDRTNELEIKRSDTKYTRFSSKTD